MRAKRSTGSAKAAVLQLRVLACARARVCAKSKLLMLCWKAREMQHTLLLSYGSNTAPNPRPRFVARRALARHERSTPAFRLSWALAEACIADASLLSSGFSHRCAQRRCSAIATPTITHGGHTPIATTWQRRCETIRIWVCLVAACVCPTILDIDAVILWKHCNGVLKRSFKAPRMRKQTQTPIDTDAGTSTKTTQTHIHRYEQRPMP